MSAVRTVEDKKAVLDQRTSEQKALGAKIDQILAEGRGEREAEELGCGGRGLCPALGRGVARVLGLRARRKEGAATLEDAAQEGGLATNTKARLFGVAARSPASKLERAASSLQHRVEALETRAQQHRQVATCKMRAAAPDKAGALRELRKAKQCEKQAASAQGVLDSLESQADLIEQTALQRQVADALGSTAKSMKKDKKLLSRAEDAVDNAHEIKDLHDDLASVMEGFGGGAAAEYDEDELLSELQGMLDESPPPGPPDQVAQARASAQQLEHKHAQEDEAGTVRARLPRAPTARAKSERLGLLSAS